MPIDYETLRIIWWLLLGVLLIGFAIMDGFDLGAAICLPFVAKTDGQRRVVINSIGATWEGNQVWFILGGGAIFAAWPPLYAVSFSGFYLAMFVILLALILRPVGFKYRSKMPNQNWRRFWDSMLFIGGFVPSLIFGVAIGNVLQGVPFHFDDSLRSFYTGSFLALLNPFALLCGVLSVCMLTMHGAKFLAVKTGSDIEQRSSRMGNMMAVLTILLFAIGGLWVSFAVKGYALVKPMLHQGYSNPLHKQVSQHIGAWLTNYQQNPILIMVPLLGFLGAIFTIALSRFRKCAFVASSLSVLGIIATVGVSMFPFILPSSSMADHSLMVWDSSSSHVTLFIMLVATVIFMPIILLYTAWVYHVLRGKISEESVNADSQSY